MKHRNIFIVFLLLTVFFSAFSNEFMGLENAIKYYKTKGELQDQLYPVGFSKKDFFSYIRIPADEAIGCYLWKFVIFDVKRNRSNYNVEFRYDECEKIRNFEDLADTYRIHFRKKLYNYGIKIKKEGIKKFPLTTKNDVITSKIKKIKRVKSRKGFTKTVYFIFLYSGKYGKKSAGKFVEFEKYGKKLKYRSHINGYIASPFNDRIIIVVEFEKRGWRGPPNISTFKLYGTSIKNGFRKRKR